jgi:predicted dehydrogenase
MAAVRIGLVGCGLFGQSHLEAFRGLPDVKVSAVFDIDRVRARRLAEAFQVPRVCESLEEICSLSEVDAIDVVTTEEAHLAPVVTALERGKHVFVEKPLALDVGECSRMIEAAQVSGRILMPGHILRFETKYALLKDALDAGRMGRIVSMQARRNRPKTLLERYSRTHPALENCIHDVDLMLWFTGDSVKRVRGYGRNATGVKHADTFWGVLEFTSGALGIVETIWLLPEQAGIALDDAFQVVGTKGIGSLQLVPGNLTFWTDAGYDAPDVGYGPVIAGAARGALREELAYFRDCVRDNRPPEVITAVEAARAVRVTLALVESSEKERDVEIDDWR